VRRPAARRGWPAFRAPPPPSPGVSSRAAIAWLAAPPADDLDGPGRAARQPPPQRRHQPAPTSDDCRCPTASTARKRLVLSPASGCLAHGRRRTRVGPVEGIEAAVRRSSWPGTAAPGAPSGYLDGDERLSRWSSRLRRRSTTSGGPGRALVVRSKGSGVPGKHREDAEVAVLAARLRAASSSSRAQSPRRWGPGSSERPTGWGPVQLILPAPARVSSHLSSRRHAADVCSAPDQVSPGVVRGRRQAWRRDTDRLREDVASRSARCASPRHERPRRPAGSPPARANVWNACSGSSSLR
jgi:hypothetical protein